MEVFKTAEYIKKPNPEPDKRLSQQLLEKKAENLTGLFGVLPAGGQTPYHFHNKRESVLIIISGQAKEVVEGKKIPIQTGDILFIPTKQKHGIVNDSDKEFRYIEFQTGDPNVPDRVDVELKGS